jgi:predicted nucleic acid-binding protein
MDVLVDSSIWIDYFRNGTCAPALDKLMDANLLITNDLILAELIPYLRLKRQSTVVNLLQQIRRLPLQIDWDGIMELQVLCLKQGSNGIGIPDLIIAQNAKTSGCAIYTLDKHFKLLSSVMKISLY